jgi:hypothetical protein
MAKALVGWHGSRLSPVVSFLSGPRWRMFSPGGGKPRVPFLALATLEHPKRSAQFTVPRGRECSPPKMLEVVGAASAVGAQGLPSESPGRTSVRRGCHQCARPAAACSCPSPLWLGLRLTLGVLTASGKSGKIAADARDTQRRCGPMSKTYSPLITWLARLAGVGAGRGIPGSRWPGLTMACRHAF